MSGDNDHSATGLARSSRNPESASDPLALGRPARVLVVDDEPDSLEMFDVLLSSLGWRVTVAASSEEALALFDAESTDLILSDISLPELDGYSLLAALRKRGARRVPAIAISGLGMDEDVERSLAAGFDAHLTKPFQLPAFFEALRLIFEKR